MQTARKGTGHRRGRSRSPAASTRVEGDDVTRCGSTSNGYRMLQVSGRWRFNKATLIRASYYKMTDSGTDNLARLLQPLEAGVARIQRRTPASHGIH